MKTQTEKCGYKLNIKKIRESKNLSQYVVATKTGLRASVISCYENEKVDLRLSSLVLICKALGCGIEEVVQIDPGKGRVK